VLVSALVVARPLVRGEDAGLVSDFSDPGGMALTLIALVGCAGWSAWRLWTKQPEVYGGAVELLLLVIAGVFFFRSFAAPYERAAWLASWEWLGLVLTLFLVRQLAVRPEEQQGLLAVMLAGAVALSAQGVYQAVYELPSTGRPSRNRAEDYGRVTMDRPEEFVREQLKMRNLHPTTLESHQIQERLERQQVHGPFFHPASMAGSLALALPILVGAIVAARRGGSPPWLRSTAGIFAVLAGIVLILTRCWSAVIAVALVGLVMLVFYWPASRGGRIGGLVIAAGLAGIGGYVLFLTEVLEPELDRWREVWPITWRLIEDRGPRGVGPSQFSFFYPRYMTETAGDAQAEPSNAVLELWAEGGLFVALAFVAAIVLFFRAVVRWWRGNAPSPPDAAPEEKATPPDPAHEPIRWEYYLGGMLGIVLAFLLRAFGLPTEDLISEAITACIRSILWFAAVAAFERIAWSAGEWVAALTAGVTALLLTLLVNAGVSYPSVAGQLWIAVALVLAVAAPRPVEWLSRHRAAMLLPVPVLAATVLCYFAFIFYPASASESVDRRTRLAADYYGIEISKAPQERNLRDPRGFLLQRIIAPLRQAEKEDSGNVRLCLQLSNAYATLWTQSPLATDTTRAASWAFEWTNRARKANSDGPDPYVWKYLLYGRLAVVLEAEASQLKAEVRENKKLTRADREQRLKKATERESQAKDQWQLAYKALQPYLRRDPTTPIWHYMLADALDKAGKTADSRQEAAEARRLDGLVKAPRKLNDDQRKQLDAWLGKESSR
jgi:O-antigen ligase